LGIAVARSAGLPSILIENFTWDHLYELSATGHPRLRTHAGTLRQWFEKADVHIQTEPVCDPAVGMALTVRPVSRPPRTEPGQVRRQLGIASGKKMVFITISGMTDRTPMFAHLADRDDLVFVAACSAPTLQRVGNVISLPMHSAFYHPDLVHAADAVIGKVGYSTLAEVHRAGVPFGYVCRENSPEMPALIRFVEEHIAGRRLQLAELAGEGTRDLVDGLLAIPRRTPMLANGAVEIAEFLQRYGV
jgi:UDP:flavonoid glycosyltransferase YjiC (YdhE family)